MNKILDGNRKLNKKKKYAASELIRCEGTESLR